MTRFRLPFVVLLLWSAASTAQSIDGNTLRKDFAEINKMQDSSGREGNPFDAGVASGFIAAIQESFDGSAFCIPKNVTRGQINATVEKWLDANPEAWHLPAWGLVMKALSAGFPCKQ
jgi:hypothetical protein